MMPEVIQVLPQAASAELTQQCNSSWVILSRLIHRTDTKTRKRK
jgi:hypothetical protein